MDCFSHICEHFPSRLIWHKHNFFFSYLTRLFTQQWSSNLFLTFFLKTKLYSLVNRCHIDILIAFHLTTNNLITVFRCWLLNTFLSLLHCQNIKKVFWIFSFNSITFHIFFCLLKTLLSLAIYHPESRVIHRCSISNPHTLCTHQICEREN